MKSFKPWLRDFHVPSLQLSRKIVFLQVVRNRF